jgi:hypothetical protein
MTNTDGPRAKAQAEWLAVWCDPASTMHELTAAVEALQGLYTDHELTAMRWEGKAS